MTDHYKNILSQHNKFIQDQIKMIEDGAKISLIHRELKPKEKQLRKELNGLLKQVAKTGQINPDLWMEYRNYLAIIIKETLDSFNSKYKDCKSFEEEKQVILQYIIFFERAPFTLQRISELTLQPQKYYKSCKKLLYAYEKLVNVADPEQR